MNNNKRSNRQANVTGSKIVLYFSINKLFKSKVK